MKVIVTGGSRGIGAECVRKFAKRGDSVAFIYKSSDDEARNVTMQTGAISVKADISRPEEARLAVNAAVSKLGGIDVLVNNAGISQIGLFTDMNDGDIENLIDSDLSSALFCSKTALKTMIRNHSGYIVNVSSMWGVTGASCEVVYSAAKSGIIGFTKALAKEVGPSNITVNCVAPGVIDTDMNKSLDEQVLKSLCEDTPLCRVGTAADVANAVLFFASENASFITGQVLGVNGGIVI